eukprot:GHVU01030347.1.p2 GENE.GHVU01030347.1~~GHVU01030347.1.p2  ORF type:complete len:115 (+),score=18.52 GHVU01030347.1:383-727(+)
MCHMLPQISPPEPPQIKPETLLSASNATKGTPRSTFAAAVNTREQEGQALPRGTGEVPASQFGVNVAILPENVEAAKESQLTPEGTGVDSVEIAALLTDVDAPATTASGLVRSQ